MTIIGESQSQTTTVGGFRNRLGNITSTKATTDSALGVGTQSPNGKMEVTYCPQYGQDHNGLVVTKNNCYVGFYSASDGQFNDVISVGQGGGTEPTYTPSPVSPIHAYISNLPLGFPINSINNSLNPIFWAREQTPNNPLGAGSDDSKFIVFPDGRTGINVANPRCALDVRGFGANKPAAIFGVNAIRGTVTLPGSPIAQRYTRHIEIVPYLSGYGYNRISQNKDLGIFFTDGLGDLGTNVDGGLVIAPWSDTTANGRAVGGMRMDKLGNVEFRGDVRTTNVVIDTKWWPDYVFSRNYQLRPLDSVNAFIKTKGHLPDMPSEESITSNGQNIGDLQKLQQQKIEELTLYAISQEEKIINQNQKIELLIKRIELLEKAK
ncbi:MAG: hypothetical protein NTZ00_02350 [Bacteroidetes bacterium]|nr:hypothetical protein [Bacteroidota bacterium]